MVLLACCVAATSLVRAAAAPPAQLANGDGLVQSEVAPRCESARCESVPATDSRISYSNGRFFTPAGEAEVRFDWIASQVSLSFSGSASVSALLTSRGAFDVTVDGGVPKLLACGTAERYVLASGLDMHATHNVTG